MHFIVKVRGKLQTKNVANLLLGESNQVGRKTSTLSISFNKYLHIACIKTTK